MNRICYFIGLLLFAMSCSKPQEVDELFGTDPDTRIADTLAYVKNTLVDAPNGWKAYLTTEYSGGYGFYMQFEENDRLKMVADLNDQTASEMKESTYRVREIMAATLSFDTYSYLTMLQDPNPSVYEGEAGKGMGSDVEFDYVKTSGDTLFFEGRKFYKPLILVKATEEEASAYQAGSYQEAIEKTTDYFSNHANPYIEIKGQKYLLSINAGTKLADGMALLPGDEVVGESADFYFTLNGVKAIGTIEMAENHFVELRWEDEKLFAITDGGEKFEIQDADKPFIPLSLLMGKKYNGLEIQQSSVPLPGTSQEGKDMLNRYFEGLNNGNADGFYFNCGNISLTWNVTNSRIKVSGFSSQNNCASGWNTDIEYDYALDSATYTYQLTKRSGPSGGYTSAILDQLDDFLTNSKFKLESYTEDGNTYGKIIGIDRPKVELTFSLVKD